MAVVVIPDEVAAILEERAARQGLTVPQLISDAVLRSERHQALEALIGSADVPVDRPLEIHRAREKIADALLQDHDELSADYARLSARSAGFSIDID